MTWSGLCMSEGAHTGNGDADRYHIYLDADQTNNTWSGRAIELGIRSAFSEVDWLLGGFKVELIVKDHHGSTARSKHHFEQVLDDEKALAVFGGLHSPPLLESKEMINAQGILTLVPWAAATPITRTKAAKNWIFRLSLDDSKAGQLIVEDTIQRSGLSAPYLLLEDTGWGSANEKTMLKALNRHGVTANGVYFFQWGIGKHEAHAVLDRAISNGADSFILVANAPEGATFANAMLSLREQRRKPIRSHWGITGGSFVGLVGSAELTKLDLRFIQTNFSFFDVPLPTVASRAMESAKGVLNLKKIEPNDIRAPAGFVHAYDLTRLLIAAASEMTLTGDAKRDKVLLRDKLESIETEVAGLLKTYVQPFRPSDSGAVFDAHEALDINDFTMARFDSNGDIRLVNKTEEGN